VQQRCQRSPFTSHDDEHDAPADDDLDLDHEHDGAADDDHCAAAPRAGVSGDRDGGPDR
jgi:hypothetical protein